MIVYARHPSTHEAEVRKISGLSPIWGAYKTLAPEKDSMEVETRIWSSRPILAA